MDRVKMVSLQCRLLFCIVGVFVWTGSVFALPATDTLQATSFSGQSGVLTTEACSEGGMDVTSIQNGTYMYFDSVNFGSSGIQCFEARIASNAAYSFPGGGFIAVHLDSLNGQLVTTCETRPSTGSWQNWFTRTSRLSGVSGVHNVYLAFSGGTGNLFNLEWVTFHGTQTFTKAGWRLSTSAAQGVWNGSIALTSATGVTPTVTIYKDSLQQRVEGFGGAFSDIGAYDVAQLSSAQRATVMRELFDQKVGAKFTEGRVPIGISDFSITGVPGNCQSTAGDSQINWSLDQIPTADTATVKTDYSMQYFRLAHDSAFNMPYVKAARQANPNLCIYGSVWTPPTWMKSNKNWQGPATCAQDSTTLTAYSLYMRKWVQGWENAGVPVYVVFPQNEPNWNVASQPACGWTGAQLRDYTKKYLVPGFINGGCNTEVWLGDFCCSNFASDLQPCLDDTLDRKLVRGCSPHRDTYAEMQQAMDTANNQDHLYWHSNQDEAMCWSGNNSWSDANNTMSYLFDYFLTGQCNIYNYWNTILDSNWNEGFLNRAQNSLITVNVGSKTVHYNYEFYTMKHFSYYAAVGGNAIKTTSTNTNVTVCGFKNPDGTIILEAMNTGSSAVSSVVKLDSFAFTASLPASSQNTFILGNMQDTSNWTPGTPSAAVLPEAAQPRSIIPASSGTFAVYDVKGRLVKMINRLSRTSADGVIWDRTDAQGKKAARGLYLIMNKSGKNNVLVQKVICQ
jgi:glucosylceramidase